MPWVPPQSFGGQARICHRSIWGISPIQNMCWMSVQRSCHGFPFSGGIGELVAFLLGGLASSYHSFKYLAKIHVGGASGSVVA